MIDAHKIVYNNLSSEEFDVIVNASFDSDDGATASFLSREGVYTEHYDGHHTIHRAKYNEVFTPRFTLIKNDYGDFDATENRKILSWLTASEKPSWLEVYKDDSNVMEWRVFGCVTSIEQYKLGNGRIVGYEFEIESSHPYAWSRKFTYPEVYATTEEIGKNDENNDYLVVSGTEEFTLTCNSDEYNKLLYPKVTITFDEGNIYFPVTTDPMVANYTMIPNVLYSYNGKLYININNGDSSDQGKYEITQSLSANTQASGALAGGYYYFSTDKTVRKVIAIQNSDNTYSDAWKTVSSVGAAVTIKHQQASKETIIAGGAPGETIMLDGTNKVISSDTSNQLKIIGDDFNWEWPSLVTGENVMTITGNCKIKFEWLEPRKVGSL